jgi:hypothetical protein
LFHGNLLTIALAIDVSAGKVEWRTEIRSAGSVACPCAHK